MTHQHYPFPLLEAGEIVQLLKSEFPDLSSSEADFKNPKMERWQSIYTALLEFITGFMPEQIHQHQLETLDQFENPELYEDAMPLFQLTVCLQMVMCACGIEDFCMGDITEPTSKRCLRNMSAVINFCYFRGTRLVVFEAIKEENNALAEQRNNLIAENKELKTNINSIKVMRAEQESCITEYSDKVGQSRHQCEERLKGATNLQKNLSDVKLCISEKQAKLAQIKAEIAEAKESGALLSQKIVPSPERMKNEVARNTRHLEQLKGTREQRKKRLTEFNNMQKMTDGAAANCTRALKFITSVKTSIDNQKEKEGEIISLLDQVMELKYEIPNLDAKEQLLKRVLANKQEKVSKVNITHAKEKETQELFLQQMLAEKERLTTQQTYDAAQKADLFNQKRQIEEEQSVNLRNHEARMASLKESYENLLTQVDVYHSNLNEAWDKVHEKFT